ALVICSAIIFSFLPTMTLYKLSRYFFHSDLTMFPVPNCWWSSSELLMIYKFEISKYRDLRLELDARHVLTVEYMRSLVYRRGPKTAGLALGAHFANSNVLTAYFNEVR
ncbi:MAG: hypothetical protein KAI29_06585, partial [Cyclobacteriaceae bacterium]|nr:hypothetical protein [Cyclobacteriaceae bacterium]